MLEVRRPARSHLTNLTPRRLTWLATVLASALVLSACIPPRMPPVMPPDGGGGPAKPAAPTQPENVTFLYHTIDEATAAKQLYGVGRPRDLVYGTKNGTTTPGTRQEVTVAHQRGALAYKYLNLTLFPDRGPWYGTNEVQRANWKLCRTGKVGLPDEPGGDHGSVPWSYSDLNERDLANAILAWTGRLKAMGYDGVFIDGGGRAKSGPHYRIASTCTEKPVKAGERSANAWFALLMRIKAQGLRVGVNMGSATADPLTRPDPTNPARNLTDVRAFEWILHENQGHPKENYPGAAPAVHAQLSTFDKLAARAVNDAKYGKGQVVEMAKARLPIGHPDRSRQERYVWALAKLAGGPVVLNTGFGFCGVQWGTTNCSRTGLAPDLVNIRLGAPIDPAPTSTACQGTSCMWIRRFQHGMVVVSAHGTPRRQTTVALGTNGCRRVREFRGGDQAGGTCVTSLRVTTDSSGWAHIYQYR